MSLYRLLVLGCSGREILTAFTTVLHELIEEGGVRPDDVTIQTGSSGYPEAWDRRYPTAVVCFSEPDEPELSVIDALAQQRVPIIPLATKDERFDDFPEVLQPFNGVQLEGEPNALRKAAAAVLDCVGLLRERRRLFISYRRTESRNVAVQLHDAMTAQGFDVFLDTHSIRPGKVFQDNLWHRLSDSDVVVMLDTETYFKAKWTSEEFGKAQESGIVIYRLVWPSRPSVSRMDLAETRYLRDTDFVGDCLTDLVIDEVGERIEVLRARGLAARFTEITGKLSGQVRSIGGRIVGTGAYRTVALELADGSEVWTYPVVGVPTALTMNDIAVRARTAGHEGPYLVYDHSGMTELWLEHLLWLDTFIPEVDFMRVSEAGQILGSRKHAP